LVDLVDELLILFRKFKVIHNAVGDSANQIDSSERQVVQCGITDFNRKYFCEFFDNLIAKFVTIFIVVHALIDDVL
jgi:hypothetical protein